MRGDLRPFRLGILRGRDGARVIGQPSLSAASLRTARAPACRHLLALGQDHPDVSGTAFVAPGALLIGRVTIGAEARVWYGGAARLP